MTKYVIYDTTESLTESVLKDIISCGLLALCIWFSVKQDSTWWTFFSTAMFILFCSGKVQDRKTKLRSKQDAIKWANSLPDDGDN